MLFILERKRKYEVEGENCAMKKDKCEKKKTYRNINAILFISCSFFRLSIICEKQEANVFLTSYSFLEHSSFFGLSLKTYSQNGGRMYTL